ncbi:endopeptidase La [Candidatus Dependentiae bacterium]|nr:endopeptidase La [Candidatus Dependentiae bacterium]
MEQINKEINSNLKNKQIKVLPVLPLKNLVTLPKSIIPVIVGRDISVKAVEFAAKKNKEIFVSTQRSVKKEKPEAKDLYQVGTRAVILQIARMPNGTFKILIEGICRSKILNVDESNKDFISVSAQDLITPPLLETPKNLAIWRNLFDLFKQYVNLSDKISNEVLSMFRGLSDLDYLADTIAVQLPLDFNQRQKVLEIIDLEKRAFHLSVLLEKEIEVLNTEKKIKKRVQGQIEKNQKDYYLNEQMRAIQRELGRQDHQQEIDKLREKSKKAKLSKDALEKVESELKRLEQMQPTSPEAAVSRNYVDWILNLPWKKTTKDNVALSDAEKILNSSHAAMKKAKERIIEFLAAKKFAGSKLKKSPIVCLAGPPGVGKTSLAMSIAESLGRKLVRISLGGMRDEAEIRGHRRTYIGAMPGKIVQSMKRAGVLNPVIVLDEVDKMAMDFRGDPASALLEVLDPEQNNAFSDYFLEVDYDLSKVMFITTANVVDNIPSPLLDRMELIELSGYTLKEKLKIAKDFLLPKLLKEYALNEKQFEISNELLLKVIEEYTKEAGVRQLERVLSKLIRKGIQVLLKNKRIKKIKVDQAKISSWLGFAKYKLPDRKNLGHIGRVTGLAWTELGGDILDVEVMVLKGKGALTLTGQLGEVMQESAQAAMSYIRSRAKDFGLKEDFYSDLDIHIHVPEGAIPKDGPSAGITIATAITSALTKIEVNKDVAMTGEVTLQGRVLPVGGLKEKLLAAARLNIKKVIVSKENEDDIKEFEKELEGKLTVVYVNNVDDVLKHSFSESPFKKVVKKALGTKKIIKKAVSKKRKK